MPLSQDIIYHNGPEVPMTHPFLTLAPELIHLIGDELASVDLRAVRLTCRLLAQVFKARVFRVLSIKVTKNTLQRDMAKIRAIAETPGAAVWSTQTLRIGALRPSYDPEYKGPTWKYVDGEWVAGGDEEDPPEVISAQREVKAIVGGAILALRAVNKVEWAPHRKEDYETQWIVMRSLTKLPNVSSIKFALPYCKIPLALDAFRGVREISLSGTCEAFHDAALEGLSRLVAQSPELTSVDLASNWRYNHPAGGVQSLHGLLAHIPADAPPLRLRHLALKVFLVRLDAVTLPHLRHLTSLDLTRVQDPQQMGLHFKDAAESDGEEGDGGTHAQEQAALLREQQRVGSSVNEIWRALKDAEIHLAEIGADVAAPALLEYLRSYAGLRRLALKPGGLADGARSDALAVDFYATALPKHAATLRALDVQALYEGAWCFGEDNSAVVGSCRALRSLKVSVVSDQLRSGVSHKVGGASHPTGPDPDVIKLLLDTVVCALPHMDHVQIYPANLEQLRGAYCGNPAMSHFAHATRLMVENVVGYAAPAHAARLPALTVGLAHLFVGQLGSRGDDADGGQGPLRYVDITPASQDIDYPYVF